MAISSGVYVYYIHYHYTQYFIKVKLTRCYVTVTNIHRKGCKKRETFSIPILIEWEEHLWEVEQMEELILRLVFGGDCQVGYIVQLDEIGWKEIVVGLLKEHKISISKNG